MVMAIFLKKRQLTRLGGIILASVCFSSVFPYVHGYGTPAGQRGICQFLVNFKSPFVGVLVGAAFTAVIRVPPLPSAYFSPLR
jgi:hypothetical protein